MSLALKKENTRMRIYLLLAMAVGASFIGSNCGGLGVGDPCVPEDEYLTGFSGFSKSEVNVESRSFQCLSRVCLVNHFQGRVSCPYGQVEDPSATGSGLSTCMGTQANRTSPECLPGGTLHRASCQVPDRDGARWEDRIVPPVEAQLKRRQASDTVYCSCRCKGPNGETGSDYCDCPSGFDCKELVEDLGIGREQLAGSYCIKEGTEYDPGVPETEECDPNLADCDERFNVTFANGDVTVGTNQRVGSCLPSGAKCEKGDECCAPVPAERCVATVGDEARNCFSELPPGEACTVVNGVPACKYEEGLEEPIFETERAECDEVCP